VGGELHGGLYSVVNKGSFVGECIQGSCFFPGLCAAPWSEDGKEGRIWR
jgi:hypothetical protein